MPRMDENSSLEKKEASHLRRNILRYLTMLLLSLIYAYLYGGFFPYTLMYLILALPVMSLIHLVVICTLFRMSECLNERIFVKGECASYRLVIQNITFFYIPYITVHMHMESQIICKNLKSMRISLAPFSTRVFQYDMPLLFRGRYDIGVKSVRIHDLLGLFSWNLQSFETKSILVKPRIVEIPHKDIVEARISEADLNSGLNETGNDDILNIRDYAYGDSFRKIHWKLTSKFSKTMVKETRNQLDNDVVILLNLQNTGDLNEAALIKEDCLIEELISHISYLLQKNIPVKLCFVLEKPVVLRAATSFDFNNIYQLLSEVKFNQTNDFNQAIDYFTDAEKTNNLVYIFTLTLDGDIISKSFGVKNKGFDLELYYVNLKGVEETDTAASRELADMLMKSNIRAYKLQPTVIELEGYQKEVTHSEGKVEVKAYQTEI